MKLTLREWRKAKGISTARLSRELGVAYTTLVRWEKGAKMPVDMAFKACDFIGIDIKDVNFLRKRATKMLHHREVNDGNQDQCN